MYLSEGEIEIGENNCKFIMKLSAIFYDEMVSMRETPEPNNLNEGKVSWCLIDEMDWNSEID